MVDWKHLTDLTLCSTWYLLTQGEMAPTTPVPPRRYTSEELLALRASLPFVTCSIKKLNQHPDLGMCTTLSSWAACFHLLTQHTGCIVYIPDAARRDPEHFSCKSSTLVDITNGKNVARRVAGSSGESEAQSFTDALGKLGKQQSGQLQQWSLRARGSSDHSSQPRRAPASKAAQQSENFQNFYRAVVSPTHVRVTAGGRIVPNTRATAPPPLDFDNALEPIKQASAEPNNAQSPSWQLSSGFTPVLPNVFAPPFIPLPQPQGNLLPMPLPIMAPHFPQPFPGADHGAIGHFSMPHLATDAGGNPLQPGLIKISPPTQFDQSRPFLYNGQWIYPVSAAPANTPLPITMLGNQGLFTPPMSSTPGFMQPQFPIPMAGMPQPMGFPGHHASMMATGVVQQPEGMRLASSFLPMLGMVPNAELLKAQVSSMRFQLKQLEDQISNTNGQADQVFMEQQRTFMLSQIGNMEAMIEHQRAHEAKGASYKGSVGSVKSREVSKHLPTENASAPELDTTPMVVSSSMGNSKKGETNEALEATSKNDTKTHSEPVTKSRLTIAAALAPPFQPRSQAVVEQNNEAAPFDSPSSDYLTILDANPQMQAEIEARFAANASASWTGPSSAVSQSYVAFSNGPTLHGEQVKKHAQPANIYRSNMFHQPIKITAEEKFAMPPGSVPYLVGTLPRGPNANGSDFMYSRPLTDEEIRARHLYWGKAPRSVQSGLPKFDGKDFYPPSPVKGKVGLAAMSTEAAATRRAATPPAMHNQSFEHLFAAPWTPGYVSPPPEAAPSSDWVTMGPKPTQPIFKNGSQTSHQQGSSFESSMGKPGPTPEDFSDLFLEPGAPGYMSPSQSNDKIEETVIYYKKKGNEMPITPKNPEQSFPRGEGDHDEARTQDSWEQNEYMPSGQFSHSRSASRDDACSSSTVEINLGQRTPMAATEQSFQERVDNFRQWAIHSKDPRAMQH
jgi:hypothetical protein